jgi:predicted nucleotidyltransferase component of viral defense system
LNVLDRRLVERVAADLLTSPGLVEKDWHVARAIAVLAGFDHGAAVPAFGGGTSLSKGWGLIKRFSEDIDFKVAMPATVSRNRAKNDRRTYRKRILAALTEADFILAGEPTRADENHFFSADLFYPNLFDTDPGLRPHIRVEMTLRPPVLPPIPRPIASLIGVAQQKAPEVAAFLCVDPVETAADKLSALAWRVHAR